MTEQEESIARTLVVRRSRDGRRCFYSRDGKQALVDRCLEPGVSVAKLARQYDLNANVLRKWVVLYQQSGSVSKRHRVARFVPVSVTPPATPPVAESVIEIEMAGATVRVRGSVDAQALSMVMACLRRA